MACRFTWAAAALLCVAADTGVEESRALDFLSWLDAIPAAQRAASLTWLGPEFGYGVVTDEAHGALDDGSLLVQLPLDAVVSRQSLKSPPEGSAPVDPRVSKLWTQLQSDEDLVALWLMRARAVGALRASGLEPAPAGGNASGRSCLALGDAAEWWPYIAVLPRTVSIPATWPVGAAGLALLQDGRAAQIASAGRSKLLDRYSRLIPAIKDLFSDFNAARMASAMTAYAALELNMSVSAAVEAGWGRLRTNADREARVHPTPLPGPGTPAYETLELSAASNHLPGLGASHDSLVSFLWAATLVDSRALTIRGEKFLVPFADMLNFSPAPHAKDRKPDGGAAYLAYHQLDKSRHLFRVLSDRPTPVGEQVYEDYGDSETGLYLQHHGMVPAVLQTTLAPFHRPSVPDTMVAKGPVPPAPETNWTVITVNRVDSFAANPFDCLHIAMPQWIKGEKGSPNEARRSIAKALGLSPTIANSWCIRPPPSYIAQLGSVLEVKHNLTGPDPIPWGMHRWLALASIDDERLIEPECERVLASIEAAKPRTGELDAAAAVSSSSSKKAAGNIEAEADACLQLGAAETEHLLHIGRIAFANLTYGNGEKGMDDVDRQASSVSSPADPKSFGATVADDLFLTGHEAFRPKTAAGRVARVLRRFLSKYPTKLGEDLGLLSSLETSQRARAAGLPRTAIASLATTAARGLGAQGRVRYLFIRTFGKESGKAMLMSNPGSKEGSAFDAADREDKGDVPADVSLEVSRLALLYRASRKWMMADLQAWLEEFEGQQLRKARETVSEKRVETPPAPPAPSPPVEAPPAPAVLEEHALVPLSTPGASVDPSLPPAIAIGLVVLPPRDAACYFTEDDLSAAAAACERFNSWFASLSPAINSVRAIPVGGGMRLGVVTTTDVHPEAVYLAAPVDAVLDADLARRDRALGPVLAGLRKKFPKGNDFHELLLLLLLEHGVRHAADTAAGLSGGVGGTPSSIFGPYMELLPDEDHMPFPLFYTPHEAGALLGSVQLRVLLEYRAAVRGKYAAVKTAVLDAYPRTFAPASAFSLGRYRWGTAILDSRSIWWGGARHLVPLLDLINCAEGPRAARVHATRLDPRGEHAVTRADRAYAAGEQVWENYGQPNWIYYLYHGFVLEANAHECVGMEFGLPPSTVGSVEAELIHRRSNARRKNSISPEAAAGSPSPMEAAADGVVWARIAELLAPPKATPGEPAAATSAPWRSDASWTLPGAAATLTRSRERYAQEAAAAAVGEGRAAADLRNAAWLSNYAYADEDDPFAADGGIPEGEEEGRIARADMDLWGAARLVRARSAFGRSAVFTVQCVKPSVLAAGESKAAAVGANGEASGSSGGRDRNSPLFEAHSDTEDALEWLSAGWGVDRQGALLLLRAHARSALAGYPTRVPADARRLLADAAAQLVLGLAGEEESTASARAILTAVYGNARGYDDAATGVRVTVKGGLPGKDDEALLPGPFPLGRFSFAHWQSEVLAQASESSYKGEGQLARARAALLPARDRASIRFLLSEKLQLLALTGWDPIGRGRGRYHPELGWCGAGKRKGSAGADSGRPCLGGGSAVADA
jgi:hypothetical protein